MQGFPSGLNSSFSLYRRPSKIQAVKKTEVTQNKHNIHIYRYIYIHIYIPNYREKLGV